MSASMRKVMIVAAGIALSLTACGQIREQAGISKKAPDEFKVVRNAPLSVPPDYQLRPPRPGARALPQLDPRREAQQATFGGQIAANQQPQRPVAGSAGEEALLRTLRVQGSEPDIRQKVDEESAILAADNRNFVERLMFWKDVPPPGAVVDAGGERKRIQENSALGRAPDTGPTPTIERKTASGISLF